MVYHPACFHRFSGDLVGVPMQQEAVSIKTTNSASYFASSGAAGCRVEDAAISCVRSVRDLEV